MSIQVDLHIHTKYSFDSFLEPKNAVKIALKRGLSAISITDHNTIRGSLDAIKEARSKSEDLIVVPGIEVNTEKGDVIGLFIQDDIKGREFQGVLEEIRNQNGLTVLPHPYHRHGKDVEELASRCDVVEALNGRSSKICNMKALKLANNLDKPAIASSDAHFSFEIGRVRTKFYTERLSDEELKKLIINGEREFVGRELPFMVHGFSFAATVIKRIINLC